MSLLLYNFALIIGLILGTPAWLLMLALKPRYREGLAGRLGTLPAPFRLISGQPVLWLHAVSVGEVLAASRLVAELGEQLPQYRIVISTTTSTGQRLAQERFGHDRVFYYPLDLPMPVNSLLDRINPALLVLMESELWPNMLGACARRKIPVAVVNARVSDRSLPRYLRLRPLWRPLLRQVRLALAQSEQDRARLVQIGFDPHHVLNAGNLKFDVKSANSSPVTGAVRAALQPQQRVVVAGSTLEGEEAALLNAWPALLERHPHLLLILAPRHPQRFHDVQALLSKSGIAWTARSSWFRSPAALDDGTVLLLDSIGELASLYSVASAAFIGGSLVNAGGHNPLEAAQYAIPVVMGPSFANFREIVSELRSENGLLITEDLPASLDGNALAQRRSKVVCQALDTLLSEDVLAEQMGRNALTVFERHAGATDKVLYQLMALLEHTHPEDTPR